MIWREVKLNRTFSVKTINFVFFNNTTQFKMDTKNQGIVKFFNSEKGFGFIKHDDSDKETFVHVSGLINEIKEGDKVEFELQNGKKGMNAVNVTVIG
jgi:CspA family cold shock protein